MICAFCGKSGKQTREHIFPKWLHNAVDYELKYSSPADKVLSSEQVTKDVCEKCNSGPLSQLDDYARSLHNSYFGKPYQSIKSKDFKYDFEKLTKWLLKISYNSSRASGATDAGLFGLYAPGIITPGCSPAFCFVSVSLWGQLLVIDPMLGTRRAIELEWCRVGPIALTTAQSAILTVRAVLINYWCFMVVIMKDTTLRQGDLELVGEVIQGAIIRPDKNLTKIPTVRLDPAGPLKHFSDKAHLYRAASRKEI